MNKKFSTLVAGLLLAGGMITVEADVVKVTSPYNGQSYVIGTVSSNQPGYVLAGSAQGATTDVQLAGTAFDEATADFYVFKGNTSAFSLVNSGKKVYGWSDGTSHTLWLNTTNDAVGNFTIVNSTKIKIVDNGASEYTGNNNAYKNKQIKVDGTSASLVASGSALAFFAQVDENSLESVAKNNVVYLKLDGKFLVRSTDEDGNPIVKKVNTVAKTNFSEMENAAWIVANAAGTKFTSFDGDYKLTVEDGELALGDRATNFKYDNETSYTPIKASLNDGTTDFGAAQLVSTAIPAELPDYVLGQAKASFKSGNTFLVSVDGKALTYDGSNYTTTTTYDPKNDQVSMWKVTAVKNGDYYDYTFVNKVTQEKLSIGGQTAFKSYHVGGYNSTYGMVLMVDGKYITPTLTTTTNISNAAKFGFYSVGTAFMTVAELQQYYGETFEMGITYDKKAVNGDPFTFEVKPVASAASDVFQLWSADGANIIVLDTKSTYSNAGSDYGYKFKVLTKREYQLASIDEPTRYLSQYLAEYVADKDLLTTLTDINLYVYGSGKVGVLLVDSKPYLTCGNEHYELLDVAIKLKNTKKVNPMTFLAKPQIFKISMANVNKQHSNYGKVLGVEEYTRLAWVNAAKVDQAMPEGQFTVTYNADDDVYSFSNVECPSADYNWTGNPYTINGADFYNVSENVYTNLANGDTLSIVPVAMDATYGYLDIAPLTVKNTIYHLGAVSNVWEGAAWTSENHADNHQVTLDVNEDNATDWRLNIVTRDLFNSINEKIETRIDTAYVFFQKGYYNASDAVFDTKEDTLKIVVYTLTNANNNEGLVANDPYSTALYSNSWFAFKKNGSNLNVVGIRDEWKTDGEGKTRLMKTLNYRKMYAGDAAVKGLLSSTYMYKRTENDLFTLKAVDAPMYRTLTPMDTISIFRADNDQQLLFEDGEFLGLKNASQFKFNPAFLVDTAYVRNNTYRPLYMLAVNPTVVPDGTYCPIHGTEPCEHSQNVKGWVEGRYLVNLKDSALAVTDLHANKYVNSEGYYKFGLVQATHKNDSLIIASTNDSIFVGDASDNVAKFAFRIVDKNTQDFVIETAQYYRPGHEKAGQIWGLPGYLKWMNGVVVATDYIEDADVFNLNADEDRTPTANEAVAAEVSVVAVKGAIIVKGAAGKVVTVANILGQTIANQVAASDNVTIAAPAGIAVVTVDGEATKVVVK